MRQNYGFFGVAERRESSRRKGKVRAVCAAVSLVTWAFANVAGAVPPVPAGVPSWASPYTEVRVAAAESLSESSPEASYHALLGDPSPRVRAVAVQALRRHPNAYQLAMEHLWRLDADWNALLPVIAEKAKSAGVMPIAALAGVLPRVSSADQVEALNSALCRFDAQDATAALLDVATLGHAAPAQIAAVACSSDALAGQLDHRLREPGHTNAHLIALAAHLADVRLDGALERLASGAASPRARHLASNALAQRVGRADRHIRDTTDRDADLAVGLPGGSLD